MAKTTKKQRQPKQDLVENIISFDNVPKDGEKTILSNSPDGDSDEIGSVSGYDIKESEKIRFNVHPDCVKLFHKLKGEYALANENYNFFVDKMFCYGVAFLKEDFTKKGLYKIPSDSFLKTVLRVGKRKKNDRSMSIKDTHSVFVKIDKSVSDDYNALLFSYMLHYDKESIADDKYSRTYFFYDFITLLDKNKKAFIKFSI